MTALVLALLAFACVHLVAAVPQAKTLAVSKFGRAYGPVYGVASLALLVLVIAAFRNADSTALYDVPLWGRSANFGLTLLAFICFGIFLFRGSWRNRLVYPMAIGVALWAAGHLLANGDSRSLILFAGLAAIAGLHAALIFRSGNREHSEERSGHNLLSVMFGIAFYGVTAQLHGALIGVPIIDIGRITQ